MTPITPTYGPLRVIFGEVTENRGEYESGENAYRIGCDNLSERFPMKEVYPIPFAREKDAMLALKALAKIGITTGSELYDRDREQLPSEKIERIMLESLQW